MIVGRKFQKLGGELKKARKKKGLTLKQASRLLGYNSQMSLFYVESGRNRIPLDKLAVVCNLYGIKIGELVDKIYT